MSMVHERSRFFVICVISAVNTVSVRDLAKNTSYFHSIIFDNETTSPCNALYTSDIILRNENVAHMRIAVIKITIVVYKRNVSNMYWYFINI